MPARFPGALAANTRDVYDDLAGLYLPIAIAVLVVVLALLVWYPIRGRRREQAKQGTESYPLEIAFAIGLAVIVVVLVVGTFRAQARIEARSPDPALQVRAIAAKWNWRFEYPQYGFAAVGRANRPPTLTVPQGVDVNIRGTSLDVVHAFWIPALRFQRELFPQQVTDFRLTFPGVGFTSNARCSFYCGLYHERMLFYVRVLPRERFTAWARARGRA
jgi:cytochrome c oxidase subunit II